MIGLERGVVRLSPYISEWKRLIEEAKAVLQTAVDQYVPDSEYVGRIAIPGMVAKTTMNIGIAVKCYESTRVRIFSGFPANPSLTTVGATWRAR